MLTGKKISLESMSTKSISPYLHYIAELIKNLSI